MWWNRGYVFAKRSRWACYATGMVRGIPLGLEEVEETYCRPLLSGDDEGSVMEPEDLRCWMKSRSLLCHKHDRR